MTPKTILFLSANPKNIKTLRLNEEVRDIREALNRERHSDRLILEHRGAVRPSDLQNVIREVKPQIVHFSGHGEGETGLLFEAKNGRVQPIATAALVSLFQLFSDWIECVVLNACYSEAQAEAIVTCINYTIGMNQQIGNQAAIAFSTGFYNALAAGESIPRAYEFGLNSIQLEGIPENLTPVLKRKPDLNETAARNSGVEKKPNPEEPNHADADDQSPAGQSAGPVNQQTGASIQGITITGGDGSSFNVGNTTQNN